MAFSGLPDEKLVQLRGVRPFLSSKYDLTKHPNYKYLSDYDKKIPLIWKSTYGADLPL